MKHLFNIDFSSSSLTDFVGNEVSSASLVIQDEGLTVHLEYSPVPYRSRVVFAGTIGSLRYSDDHLRIWLIENGADMKLINFYLQEHVLASCADDSGTCTLIAKTEQGDAFTYKVSDESEANMLGTFMYNRGWIINGVEMDIVDYEFKRETPELEAPMNANLLP
ncbi:hypothetical protein F7Q91_03570 [Vibrio chagasii]|uniref:Uncharacterized protein n=1 Tax=Vibrio chagasii TaxID=170679 RepID=A0A7V7NX82_9VIBR|nr:hypothetical protein [Vibrio chagasii]KAB0482502.1 hypothetical protein F7Q91_03570 [Vibrio chagasii]